VFEKKWRDYFFWQPYTEEQVQSTNSLCNKLLKEMKIKPQIVEHNTKIAGIEKYVGIVSKSNYDTIYTDLSPAFNFNELLKKIENE
jgi:N-acetyl-anhydromuramyl-L-alanine amidase AmpD